MENVHLFSNLMKIILYLTLIIFIIEIRFQGMDLSEDFFLCGEGKCTITALLRYIKRIVTSLDISNDDVIYKLLIMTQNQTTSKLYLRRIQECLSDWLTFC